LDIPAVLDLLDQLESTDSTAALVLQAAEDYWDSLDHMEILDSPAVGALLDLLVHRDF